MQLIGFSISEDFIHLECGAHRFDLHNDFDFQGLSYSLAHRKLDLHWCRSTGSWVKLSNPSELSLSFAGVHLFKVQERDSEMPFTEDDCLDSMGFIWEDQVDTMRAFTSNRTSEGCSHFIATFNSGFSIKVGAAYATLHLSDRA